MFLVYLAMKRMAPRYTIQMTLVAGTAFAAALGLIDFSHFHVALARPVFTMPHFSVSTAISIGAPRRDRIRAIPGMDHAPAHRATHAPGAILHHLGSNARAAGKGEDPSSLRAGLAVGVDDTARAQGRHEGDGLGPEPSQGRMVLPG